MIILEGCTVELAEEETDVFAFKVRAGDNKIVEINKQTVDCADYFPRGGQDPGPGLRTGEQHHGGPGGLDEVDRLRQLRLHEADGGGAPATAGRAGGERQTEAIST